MVESFAIDPSEYPQQRTEALLLAAGMGHIRFDKRLLRALLEHGNRSAQEILDFHQRNAEDTEQRVDLEENLVDLLRHLKSADAAPMLIGIALREPEDIPDAVVEALCDIGQPAVDPLLEAIAAASAQERQELRFLLATLPVRDPRILEELRALFLEDPEDALIGFGLHADPGAIPMLEKLAADSPRQREEIQSVIESLRQPQEQREPFSIWNLYPEQAPPLFEILPEEELLPYLKSPLPEYRMRAAQYLGNVADEPDVKHRLLDLATGDPEGMVRARAWEALSAAVDDESLVELMATRFEDANTSPEEHAALLLCLAPFPIPSVHALIEELHAETETRALALEAMWRSGETTYTPQITAALDNPDPMVQRQAIVGVGAMELADQAQRLLPFLQQPEIRSDALYSYAMAAPLELREKELVEFVRQLDEAAFGLDEDEVELVHSVLDERLIHAGRKPLFGTQDETDQIIH